MISIPSHLRTYFVVLLTARRNFIPILSVYYLTLPSTDAAQIGLYTGLGFLASFFLNVPAGMLADKYGYRRTLIFTKILLLSSSLSFVFADGFLGFILGAVLGSLGADAFMSGTGSSYLRDHLDMRGLGSEYKKISSRLKGDISLLSIGLIIALPFLTHFDIRLPLMIGAGIDLIGLIASFFLPETHSTARKSASDSDTPKKSLFALLRELKGGLFLPLAAFSGCATGFLLSDAVYRIPYLTSLGYPIIFAGVTMGLSRFVWYLVGRNIDFFLQFRPQTLLKFDIALFTGFYLLATFVTNPYILAVWIILMLGYFWGRSEIYNDMFFEHMPDPSYKATLLSLRSQFANIIMVVFTVSIGFAMAYSYRLGFGIMGVALFVTLGGIYFVWLRNAELVSPEKTQLNKE